MSMEEMIRAENKHLRAELEEVKKENERLKKEAVKIAFDHTCECCGEDGCVSCNECIAQEIQKLNSNRGEGK